MKNTLLLKRIFLLVFIIGLAVACSTEKNTFINRSYHYTTARYNAYFNGNELLNTSLNQYRLNRQENYYEVLPIEALPNKDEVILLYPAIDTAIKKSTKMIQYHSMPGMENIGKKKEEHNNWIDENWILIGKALYYRMDYDGAIKNFQYVKKFYSNDPSIYVSELWLAKTNIELGKLTEAGFNLDNLDKAIEEQEGQAKGLKKLFAKKDKGGIHSKKKKKKKSKNKKDEEEEPAKFPKSLRFDVEKTRADWYLHKNDPENAIKHLQASLDYAKKKDKARLYFIIGQLYEKSGNRGEAYTNYSKSLKYYAPYPLEFNTRMKRAFMGGSDKVRKELNKMLHDAKNAPYKDQIYYALAEMDIQNGNIPSAKENLTKSAFYSTSNPRQKGLAYEKLGNMSFSERDYVRAQKYYDSCSTVIDDSYPNAEAIRNKALKLSDLVKNIEIAEFEDSVQRIASMDEGQREDFIKNVIKKQKEEAQKRKEQEAQRLLELQSNQSFDDNASGNGSKWYFYNTKTRSEGYDEFRKQWGDRKNEDDWRRSEKTPVFTANSEAESDSSNTEQTTANQAENDTNEPEATVESLLTAIPLTDSSYNASVDRMLEALYNSGMIYKEQLNERTLAEQQFNKVMDKHIEGEFDMSSAYQLYKMNDSVNSTLADQMKNYLLITYPNSDYANYLRDPDYFIKRKERNALAEQEYLVVLNRYNRGLYQPVIARADVVIEQEKDNQFRPKYMLLKAMCIGQLYDDKTFLLPTLNLITAEYPGTEEAERAAEMINIINKGYSKNEAVDFEKNYPFIYDAKQPHTVMIFLDKKENINIAKGKVTDFNREFFSRSKLKISSKIYKDDQSYILVQGFENSQEAEEYQRVFKATRKHLLDLQNAKTEVITLQNLGVLQDQKNLEVYDEFYEEYY